MEATINQKVTSEYRGFRLVTDVVSDTPKDFVTETKAYAKDGSKVFRTATSTKRLSSVEVMHNQIDTFISSVRKRYS